MTAVKWTSPLRALTKEESVSLPILLFEMRCKAVVEGTIQPLAIISTKGNDQFVIFFGSANMLLFFLVCGEHGSDSLYTHVLQSVVIEVEGRKAVHSCWIIGGGSVMFMREYKGVFKDTGDGVPVQERVRVLTTVSVQFA